MLVENSGLFFYSLLYYSLKVCCSERIECMCENTVCGLTSGRCMAISGCFTLLKQLQDNKDKRKYMMRKGCLGDFLHKEIICNRQTDYLVICCKTNFCNQNVTLATLQATEKTYSASRVARPKMTKSFFHFKTLFLITCVLSSAFLVILLLCFCHKRRQQLPEAEEDQKSQYPLCSIIGKEQGRKASDLSGKSGGLSPLVQITIAKQLNLMQSIGTGKYGEVWRAKWRDRDVAVKIFLSHCETSWKRETEIYTTVLLRHDYILGFIASDIASGADQQTNMYIITDYHPNGSLQNYLKSHTLTASNMIKLALSASKGLCHLHTEIQGTHGKPAIAHRDIKSQNILVKENLTCCLADFGLAVKYSSEREEIGATSNGAVGTPIYMAPEVLGDTLNCNNFGALKMADVYSFGLVLWEVIRKCCCDETGLCEEYQRPYLDVLPSDPSFEDVKRVVVTEKLRPLIYSRWKKHELLRTMAKIVTECWAHDPAARLTALRVQKSINKLKKSVDCTYWQN